MTTKIKLFLLSLVISATGVVHATATPNKFDCQKLADAFLAKPTENAMSALQTASSTQCWSVFNSSDTYLGKILDKVQKGNYWAAIYVGKNLKHTDGANLEDALTALGQFSDIHMETALLLVKNGVISESELSDAVSMFPASTGEEQAAQLAVMKARAEKLESINRKDLIEQKTSTLKAVNDFIAEIKAPKSDN
jgi:hypothetical protein